MSHRNPTSTRVADLNVPSRHGVQLGHPARVVRGRGCCRLACVLASVRGEHMLDNSVRYDICPSGS